MELTEVQINEIAELLDCGMICYYHKLTGNIESITDPDNPYFDPEPWQDVIDKIENDISNYVRFEQMNSNESFQVMKDFSMSLSDSQLKENLLRQLSKPKPFQKFKYQIDNSDYRNDWFEFKKKAYAEFVKSQL